LSIINNYFFGCGSKNGKKSPQTGLEVEFQAVPASCRHQCALVTYGRCHGSFPAAATIAVERVGAFLQVVAAAALDKNAPYKNIIFMGGWGKHDICKATWGHVVRSRSYGQYPSVGGAGNHGPAG
jgi:hypothetical protein